MPSPGSATFFGADFVTVGRISPDHASVTDPADVDWSELKPQVFSTLMDCFNEGVLVVDDTPVVSDTTILDDDDEIVAMIKELLETRIRPRCRKTGETFHAGFDEGTGVVRVQLAGSCQGCPSSSVTLKSGVENMLMHYIPEVTAVESVDADQVAAEKEQLEFMKNLGAKPSMKRKEHLEFMTGAPDIQMKEKTLEFMTW